MCGQGKVKSDNTQRTIDSSCWKIMRVIPFAKDCQVQPINGFDLEI